MNRDLEPHDAPRDMRLRYTRSQLDEDHLADDPMEQFRRWFSEITESRRVLEPNAMSLATVGDDGAPSVRTVLLKGGLEHDVFWFFTNFTSGKGLDLAANACAALAFLWREWERQVCVRGLVDKLPPEENERYFQSRPYESQIGAWTSHQSQAIPDRAWLEERDQRLRQRFPEGAVPCPDFWGGYALRPLRVEFWQGRPGRLHDRFRFERTDFDGAWERTRLCP